MPKPLPLPAALALTLALAASAPSRGEETTRTPETYAVYVGTYGKGIYRFDFHTATGKAGEAALAAETPSPSFLALAPSGRFLYAVNEIYFYQGEPVGTVSGFAVDPATGTLSALNAESTGGAGPCHLVVDRAGKHVLAANYGGGSVAVLPVGPDGRLGRRTAFVRHTGSGANPDRQKEPHAHSINLDPANRFAVAADLGADKVFVYRFDPAAGTLAPNDPPAAPLPPGAGPRHVAFHPSGKFVYAINELNSTVTAWAYDADRGAFSDPRSVPTLPEGYKGPNAPADVQVHPSGRFLYGSNRGHDSIVAYTIDPGTGALTLVGHQGEGVKNPRNFGIDPTGRYLLVASQDADTVSVFTVDLNTGALTPTGHSVKVPKPVCVKFRPTGG